MLDTVVELDDDSWLLDELTVGALLAVELEGSIAGGSLATQALNNTLAPQMAMALFIGTPIQLIGYNKSFYSEKGF